MNDESAGFRICGDIRFRVIAGEGVIIRQEAGEAPLRESLAAAILRLSGWDRKTPLPHFQGQ